MRRSLIAFLLFAWILPGCSARPREWFDRRSPREWLDVALDDPRPDERRKAVLKIAESSEGESEWAAKAFDTIARTDSDSMVRVAAIRGLRYSARSAAAPTLVRILGSAQATPEDPGDAGRLEQSRDRQGAVPGTAPQGGAHTRPADSRVRWEAAIQLADLSASDGIAEPDRESVITALIAGAADADRNVRLTSLAALRCFADARVLPVLIESLRLRDLAIQRRAGESLTALTGQTHHDADAWAAWLAAANDPFAGRQLTPQPDRSWLAKLFDTGD